MTSVSSDAPRVISINISPGGVPKLPVPEVRITESGLEGDGHNHDKHNRPTQAVCLQDIEAIEELRGLGYPLGPGTAGENLTIAGLRVNRLPVGTRLSFAGGVELEITRVRPPCYVMDQIHPRLKEDAVDRHGMYARVLREGTLTVGEAITTHPPR